MADEKKVTSWFDNQQVIKRTTLNLRNVMFAEEFDESLGENGRFIQQNIQFAEGLLPVDSRVRMEGETEDGKKCVFYINRNSHKKAESPIDLLKDGNYLVTDVYKAKKGAIIFGDKPLGEDTTYCTGNRTYYKGQ